MTLYVVLTPRISQCPGGPVTGPASPCPRREPLKPTPKQTRLSTRSSPRDLRGCRNDTGAPRGRRVEGGGCRESRWSLGTGHCYSARSRTWKGFCKARSVCIPRTRRPRCGLPVLSPSTLTVPCGVDVGGTRGRGVHVSVGEPYRTGMSPSPPFRPYHLSLPHSLWRPGTFHSFGVKRVDTLPPLTGHGTSSHYPVPTVSRAGTRTAHHFSPTIPSASSLIPLVSSNIHTLSYTVLDTIRETCLIGVLSGYFTDD